MLQTVEHTYSDDVVLSRDVGQHELGSVWDGTLLTEVYSTVFDEGQMPPNICIVR